MGTGEREMALDSRPVQSMNTTDINGVALCDCKPDQRGRIHGRTEATGPRCANIRAARVLPVIRREWQKRAWARAGRQARRCAGLGQRRLSCRQFPERRRTAARSTRDYEREVRLF